MEESFEMAPTNLKENSKATIPNAPERLENYDVELKFQLKILEFMDFMNQELKCGKEEKANKMKIIVLLIMQGLRFFSSTKK